MRTFEIDIDLRDVKNANALISDAFDWELTTGLLKTSYTNVYSTDDRNVVEFVTDVLESNKIEYEVSKIYK